MNLQSLREFELEMENRRLRRIVCNLTRKPLPPIDELPSFESESMEMVSLERIIRVKRDYDLDDRSHHTVLECSQPRANLKPGDSSLPVWRSAYYIDARQTTTNEHVAHVAADMHRRMLLELHAGFLGRET